MIPIGVVSMSLVEHDNRTFLLCDDVNKGRVDFSQLEFQQAIAMNHMRGNVELLRICARNLTNSQKDFHIVNSFIDELEKISDKELADATAMGNIEVVE